MAYILLFTLKVGAVGAIGGGRDLGKNVSVLAHVASESQRQSFFVFLSYKIPIS